MTQNLEELFAEEIDEVIKISATLNFNISRTLKMIRFSNTVEIDSENQKDNLAYLYDIIRASIVFFHAALETALRDVLRIKLKYDGDLSYIPLYSKRMNDKKFTLKDLVAYREELVGNVIDKSIDYYVSNTSFGSWDAIISIFDRAGLNLKPIADKYSSLDKMIQRRHQIVHELDLVPQTDEPNPVNIKTVADWIDKMPKFLVEVLSILIDDVYRDDIGIRWKAAGLINDKRVVQMIKVHFTIDDEIVRTIESDST